MKDKQNEKQKILLKQKMQKAQMKQNQQQCKCVGIVDLQNATQFIDIINQSQNKQNFLNQDGIQVYNWKNNIFIPINIQIEELYNNIYNLDAIIFTCQNGIDIDEQKLIYIEQMNGSKQLIENMFLLMIDTQDLMNYKLNSQSEKTEQKNKIVLSKQIQNIINKYFYGAQQIQLTNIKDYEEIISQQILNRIKIQKRRLSSYIIDYKQVQDNIYQIITLSNGKVSNNSNLNIYNLGNEFRILNIEKMNYQYQRNELVNIQNTQYQQDQNYSLNNFKYNPEILQQQTIDEQKQEQAIENDQEQIEDYDESEQQDIELEKQTKRVNFNTPEELLKYPDDININPDSQLNKLFQDWFTMKSLRNSFIPSSKLTSKLYHIKNPIEIENQIFKQSENIIKDSQMCILTVQYYGQDFIQPNSMLLRPINVVFQFEEKYTLYHVKLVSILGNITSQDPIQFTDCAQIQLPYNTTLLTSPTPYNSLSDSRGKLLRVFNTSMMDQITLAFPAPYQIESDKKVVFITYNVNGQNIIFKGILAQMSLKPIILQRVVITGWPYKIHGPCCVVKLMFFNQQDVKYFINQTLYDNTRGINGKIINSLAEKGHFKAWFDNQIMSGDEIELRLYKQIEICETVCQIKENNQQTYNQTQQILFERNQNYQQWLDDLQNKIIQ